MRPVLDFFANLYRFHKLKIALAFVMTALFGLLLFPFNDLSDVVTAKVAEATDNTLYLQFDDLDFKFIPALGLTMANVYVESTSLPPVKASSISVSPWILGALTGRQGASIDADGLMGGVIAADYREGDKIKSEQQPNLRKQSLAVDAQGIKLPLLSDFLRSGQMMNLNLRGSMNISSQLQFDPSFTSQQPAGQIAVTIAGFSMPAQVLQANMNGVPIPVPLPELLLGQTKMDAKMGDGQLDIQSLSFGGPKEPMNGSVKGRVGVTFAREMGGVRPMIGNYDLVINMQIKKDFLAANESSGIGTALGLLRDYRRDEPQGVRYAFRVQGDPGRGGLPQLSAAPAQ